MVRPPEPLDRIARGLPVFAHRSRASAPPPTAPTCLLMVTAAKAFFYDLSTLTSIYRVVSFPVLGGLLLAGAFAYQRLRPPAAAGPPHGSP
jgi:uncharacterized membrane protein